jgi:AraC family transcriptional regulator
MSKPEMENTMLSHSAPTTSKPKFSLSKSGNLLGSTLTKLLDDANRAVELDTDAVHSCSAQATLFLEAGRSVDQEPTLAVKRGGLASWQEARIAAHIEKHLDARIRTSDLAALSRLSTSYFSVPFRRSFGTTVQTYVARQRVERAKTLMVSTLQPLSEIAVACGFCDQAHLCRQFRRIIGDTPGSWRNEHVGQPPS